MRKRFINVSCIVRVNKGNDFVEGFINVDELQNEDSIPFIVPVLHKLWGQREYNSEI